MSADPTNERIPMSEPTAQSEGIDQDLRTAKPASVISRGQHGKWTDAREQLHLQPEGRRAADLARAGRSPEPARTSPWWRRSYRY